MLKNRTVLIGLDGATFTVLDALMLAGVMPNLKKFIASSVRGELLSVIPPLTAPAWTSLMTGRSPSNHGIFDFLRFESEDSRYLTLCNSRHISCETIWSIVSRQGLRAISLNFAMMAPIRPISGYIIPGWMPWRLMRRVFYPEELYDKLKAESWFNLKELAMDVNMDEKAVEGCPEEEYEDWIQLHIKRERQWFEVLRYLMLHDPCHLQAIVFDGVDKLQHLCWRFLDPALIEQNPSSFQRKIRALCLEYFRQLDQFIAEIVALAGKEANVFIVSDHGFGATTEIFYLNAWLNQHGYLQWTDDAKADENSFSKLGLSMPRKQAYLLDWTKTTAYAITPSSNGIHICVAGVRGEEGIPPSDYDGFRRKLTRELLSFTDPATGQAVVTRVFTKEEAFAGSQINDAPDLTVTLRDNGFISILKSDVLLKQRAQPLGTHLKEGIFIASGPFIRKGIRVSQLSILDVAPTLLYSLGLEIPEDFEGRMPEEIFEPSHVLKHPVRRGSPTLPQKPFPQSEEGENAEEQAKILARLKALGYVE